MVKGSVKKRNKRIRNDRTRSLQEVRAFYRRYFSLRVNNQDFMEPEQTKSKWSVTEPLAVTVHKTPDDHRVDIPGKRDHQVYISSLQLPPRSDSVKGTKSNVLLHVRDWWKKFSSPVESKLVAGRRNNIKNGDPQKKRRFVKNFKVSIREVKACNSVSVNRFHILVNCGEQFFLFHKPLSS